jgi:hypothetical protein
VVLSDEQINEIRKKLYKGGLKWQLILIALLR